jgi:hypothetical protein
MVAIGVTMKMTMVSARIMMTFPFLPEVATLRLRPVRL